jgi:hypothetical protein
MYTLYSCTHWLRPPPLHPPAFGLVYEGAIGRSAKIDDISLVTPLLASIAIFSMMSILIGYGNIYVLLADAFVLVTILKILHSTVPQLQSSHAPSIRSHREI